MNANNTSQHIGSSIPHDYSHKRHCLETLRVHHGVMFNYFIDMNECVWEDLCFLVACFVVDGSFTMVG